MDENQKPTRNRPWAKALYICSEFTAKHNITIEDLQKESSTKTFSRLRQELARQLRNETPLSWSEIGEIVGRKNYRVNTNPKKMLKKED